MKKFLPYLLFITVAGSSFAQTTYTVNTTDDLPDININDAICADANGNCTLRAAIQNANKTSAKDIIAFNISGTVPFTIVIETSELPTITYPIVIDGRTQSEYAISNSPVIEIDGSGLPINNSGLKLYGLSDNSEIYGLSIGGFQRSEVTPFPGGLGIDVFSQNNTFKGNYIGLKPDGTTLNRNFWGVYFLNSGNNTFGGTGDHEGNVVSGNYSGGVTFDGVASSNNTVQGNLFGTDATGLLPRGNRFNLQFLNAPNNIVGGNTPQARNILSAGVNNRTADEDGTGISMSGVNATNNIIIGNYIGTDITGTTAIPNTRGGILLLFGANNNTIGGESAGERNVISGNGFYSTGAAFLGGIYFQSNVDSNTIKGNYIGVDATGNVALPNSTGIFITIESNNNIIGGTTPTSRNIISGNTTQGITINGGDNNRIIGNYIGTNFLGTAAIANNNGIYVAGSNTIIGEQAASSRNIISGNSIGIYITGSTASGSSVKNNYIGLNASGNAALPNITGVSMSPTSISCVIGGPDPLDRNIISGNSNRGIIASGGSLNNIQNNYIGLNPSGTGVIKNNRDGLILTGALGDTQISENVISGNGISASTGSNVLFQGASGGRFFSNIVGTLPDGITGVANPGPGILIFNSSNNIIGGDSEGQGNIIAGNSNTGIYVRAVSNNNIIVNNKIGVGLDGTTNIGNGVSGVEIGGDIVGGTIANNIIANSSRGVYLNHTIGISTQIRISQNSIFNNSIIGIDLGGTTENDAGDADAGVNNLQNTPVISAIVHLGNGALQVTYAVPSTITNSAYPMVIEFFGAANGQGKFFIQADSYLQPGNKTVTLTLPAGYDVDDYLTIVATATDANGNTSEFGNTTDSTLSIAQLVNNTFKVYPNPVSDKLIIQSLGSGNYDIEVMNFLGQRVQSQQSQMSSTSVDVTNLKNGIYFLNIGSSDGSSQTIKFIKK